jgi:hypothetical protein
MRNKIINEQDYEGRKKCHTICRRLDLTYLLLVFSQFIKIKTYSLVEAMKRKYLEAFWTFFFSYMWHVMHYRR